MMTLLHALLLGSMTIATTPRGQVDLQAELVLEARGIRVGDGAGEVLAPLPDLDGDGHDDLAVGAPLARAAAGERAGIVRWISGRTGNELGRYEGRRAGWLAGAALLAVPDQDGDGLADLLVGAPGVDVDPFPDPEITFPGAGAVLLVSTSTGARLPFPATGLSAQAHLGSSLALVEVDTGPRGSFSALFAGAPGAGLVFAFDLGGNVLGAVGSQVAADEFARSLAIVSDLDGDGIPDLAVGAPGTLSNAGRVFLLSGLTGTPIRTIDGAAGARLGTSLVAVEDRDGDGLFDLVAGAPGTGDRPGLVHLLSTATGVFLATASGASGDRLGTSLTVTHDVDGDGRRDLLAGAPRGPGQGQGSGEALLLSGMDLDLIHRIAGRFPSGRTGQAVAALAAPGRGDGGKTSILVRIESTSTRGLDAAVAFAGDLDGDGQAEFALGAPLASPMGLQAAGRVRVFSGRAGTALLDVAGATAGERLGSAIASLSDLDGDGVPEIAVGAPATATGPLPGRVVVLSGRDGRSVAELTGRAAGERFGLALASGADIDGDGVQDLLVGAPGADPSGRADAGRLDVFSGADLSFLFEVQGIRARDRFGSTVAFLGDVDGDGVPDLLCGAPAASPGGRTESGTVAVLSGASGATIRTLTGENFFDHFGTGVAGISDLDGDSVSEILVGAPNANPGGRADAGTAFVFSGASGALLRRIDGAAALDEAGRSVARTGDVDGDAFEDFVVGAALASDATFSRSGRVVVVSGRNGQILLRLTGSKGEQALGQSVAGAGDVDGDGFPEILVAGSGLASDGSVDHLLVLDPEVAPSLLARAGTVNRGVGAVQNVLFVNGSAGTSSLRRVRIPANRRVNVELRGVPGSTRPRFNHALYGWPGRPDETTVTPQPFLGGSTVFPTPLSGGSPQPALILNSFLDKPCLGRATVPSAPGPGVVISLPPGLGGIGSLTLQGFVVEDGSRSRDGGSITNAVVVIIE
jgi:hypothetical protein